MLLVVLTTVMISFIAVFAQLLTLQTAKMYNSENGLMETMVIWHNAAVTMVHKTPAMVFPATGCAITTPVLASSPAAGTPCAGQLSVGSPYLPSGYSSNYLFYSVAFESALSLQPYVLTFVWATDANNFLYLPDASNTISSGFTPGDLMSQLQRAAPFDITWGGVTSGPVGQNYNILTQVNEGGDEGGTLGTKYYVPNSIPVGAIGLISPGN